MPVTPEAFRHALGRFPSGVTVVTTADTEGNLHGLTVSAFSSLSLNPPYILVCIDKRSGAIPAIQANQKFAVNILADDQRALSDRFASRTEDKFTGIPWQSGELGQPLLDGSLVQLECSLAQSVDGGDHVVIIGQVDHSVVDDTKAPLIYHFGKYGVVHHP